MTVPVVYATDRRGHVRPHEIVHIRTLTLPGPWVGQAACAGLDPAMFFPERGDPHAVREAKAVCGSCPVPTECLEWALANNERDGIWGGRLERERRAIRRRRNAA